MGWLDALRGQVVAIDSAPLIYFIEKNPVYLPALIPFFELVESGELRCVTSVVTITEVLVLPLRLKRTDLAAIYRDILLGSPHILTLPITDTLAEQAAIIRATHNLSTPDSFQLATALEAGAAAFMTNDTAFNRITSLAVLQLDHVLGSP